MYKVSFGKKAKKQFYKLDRFTQTRLTKAIDEKLAIDPKKHLFPLTGELSGLYKFRVGEYRLLCTRNDHELQVLVVKVKHRRDVYNDS